MFKIKKLFINTCTLIYLLLSFLELMKYLKINSNLYGLIYLLINLLLIFLLLPIAFNYKRHFSKQRISKIIIFIIIGLFNIYFLDNIIINNMSYIDASLEYFNEIKTIRTIFLPILYILMIIFLIFESKLNIIIGDKLKRKVVKKSQKRNNI